MSPLEFSSFELLSAGYTIHACVRYRQTAVPNRLPGPTVGRFSALSPLSSRLDTRVIGWRIFEVIYGNDGCKSCLALVAAQSGRGKGSCHVCEKFDQLFAFKTKSNTYRVDF